MCGFQIKNVKCILDNIFPNKLFITQKCMAHDHMSPMDGVMQETQAK